MAKEETIDNFAGVMLDLAELSRAPAKTKRSE
jgi:hypothetical protein